MPRLKDSATDNVGSARYLGTQTLLRVIAVILAVVFVLWLLYELEAVILLVVIATFFAYLVAPLVEIARRALRSLSGGRATSRGLAICVVYVVLFGSLAAVGALLLPKLGSQIADFGREAPAYAQQARQRIEHMTAALKPARYPAVLRETFAKGVAQTMNAAAGYLTAALGIGLGIIAYLPGLILVPILAFFLLKDADSFRKSALRALPRGRFRGRGANFFEEVNHTLAAYIRAQLLACLLIGAVCTLGFFIIGVPYALVLGLAAGMLEFIPLLGPLLVATIAVAVTSFHSTTAALVVVLFLGALRIAQDYIIYPRLIGRGIHLHPLAVILAVLSGAELGGVLGIFLAIPIVAILDVGYRHWLKHSGSAGLVRDLLEPQNLGPLDPSSRS